MSEFKFGTNPGLSSPSFEQLGPGFDRNSTSIILIGQFYHLFAPEIPRDVAPKARAKMAGNENSQNKVYCL